MRDDEIYGKRMRGATLRELADEYGMTHQGIGAIVRRVSLSMPERDRSELLGLSVEWLDDLREKVLALYLMDGAPVTSGKDGLVVHDPETGAVVRDYGLRRSSLELMLKLNQTYAKRLGLDAPAQSEVKASVQYEIVGVDPDALT